MTEKRTGLFVGLAIAAVLVILAGMVGGQYLLPPRPPATLQPAAAAQSFAVETAEFDDARTVQVAFDAGNDTSLTLPGGGRVTKSACAADGTLKSGQLVASVDGQPILALHTSTPLWQSLAPESEGADVDAIRVELARLGADLNATGTVNDAVLEAVARKLNPDVDEDDLPKLEAVPGERIMWLPAPEVTMRSCSAAVGATVEAGAEFGKVKGSLTSARIESLPLDLAPGARTLKVSGVTVPVDDSGAVSDAAALLELSGVYTRGTEETDGGGMGSANSNDSKKPSAPGVLALVENSAVSAVPPAAVFGVSESGGCLTAQGASFAINIVGSRLGKTYFTPVDAEAALPTRVDVPKSTDRTCAEK